MKFEKKYWSSGEFALDKEGKNLFQGYVGIFDGDAYVFETGEKLTSLNTYIGRINTSTKNFDRTLSHELKLPYKKNDISFAANDFLYGGSVKSIVDKLQANNDYLFQNAIISNSALPYADKCVLFTSIDDDDSINGSNPVRGKLAKGDFSNDVFIRKLNNNDRFYPSTAKVEEYYVKNTLGLASTEVSKDINYITREDRAEDTLNLADMSGRDVWIYLNGEPPYEDVKVSEDEAKNSFEPSSGFFALTDYSFNGLQGGYAFSESSKEHELVFTTPQLKNMWDDLMMRRIVTINSEINLQVKSLGFIIQGSATPLTINEKVAEPVVYAVKDNVSYVVYEFAEPLALEVLEGQVSISLAFSEDVSLATFEGAVKFDAKYTTGSTVRETSQYKYISDVRRNVSYSFAWKDEGSETINYVPSEYTYGYLKETELWRAAKSPSLVMNDWNEEANFIPADSMTAEDVYIHMLDDVDSYEYPELYKTYKYELFPPVLNTAYIPKVYSIGSYAIDEDNIIPAYKKVEEIYRDLEGEKKDAYDKVPEVYKQTKLVTSGEDELWHNFNEITSSDIVIKSINKEEGKADLLIFLAFRSKLIIFRTNYYYEDESKNFSKDPIKDEEAFKDFIIDLRPQSALKDGEVQQYIEISRIDPDDNTSLEFLNLNSVKIHDNMMYLVDNKLDMVLRYDIDYLVSELEPAENAFSIKSIKLLDVLQGSGTSTDKIYFNNPYSIAVADDFVVIADRGNRCLKMFTPSLNFLKVIKNGPFSRYDIQTVAVNPYPCVVRDTEIAANSIWVASVQGTSIFITILEDDIVKVHGRVEDINLLQNEYTWLEEIRGITFSESHSNYFYLNTTKRIYKFHASKPFSPYASMNYFKQRALVGAMRWNSLRWPWHKLPYVYAQSEENPDENDYVELKWDYVPPAASLEILDNKCFCLTSSPEFKGDIIFHFGILYNDSKMRKYINEHKSEFGGSMTFYDITPGALANMIISSAMLMYRESDSYISSLANEHMRIYDTFKLEQSIEEDYINSLTFNKMIHSLVFNLLKIKNSLVGHYRAATTLDNIIAFDNLVLDDYFNNLKINRAEDYFIHDNEPMSIIVNRTFENILDLQEKILAKMQTEFMSAQSFVNNASRLI